MLPKTSSKTRITDEINNKFPHVTDGSQGDTNFFTPNYKTNALATGMYPQ